MLNPFESIEAKLSNIENLLLDLKRQPKAVDSLPDKISIAEAEKLTGLKRSALYKLTMAGTIPCSHFGKRLIFSRKKLLVWVEQNTIQKENKKDHIVKHLQKEALKKL